jgi:hypothetical protein
MSDPTPPFQLTHTVVKIPGPRMKTPEPHEITTSRDAPADVQEAMDDLMECFLELPNSIWVGESSSPITYDREKHTARFIIDGLEYSFTCKVKQVR